MAAGLTWSAEPECQGCSITINGVTVPAAGLTWSAEHGWHDHGPAETWPNSWLSPSERKGQAR